MSHYRQTDASNIQTHTHTHTPVHTGTKTRPALPSTQTPGVYNIHRYIQVHPGTCRYTQVHTDTHKFTNMAKTAPHTNVRCLQHRYTQVHMHKGINRKQI